VPRPTDRVKLRVRLRRMSIFKAYDVRGVVPGELGEDDAYRVGRATARFLGGGEVAVGRDARTSSPALRDALVRGLADEGVWVTDLGLVSTPMLYFAVHHHALDGGIMVTASHNPAQYNGFKICGREAVPVGEASGLREIERLAASLPPVPSREPRIRQVSLADAYVDHVLSVGKATQALRVVLDCGNGMASVGLEPLLARLPLEVERLYFEPDGTFPNHPADPLKEENLADLRAALRRCRADFGVAFDGDGDRAIFVDEHATPLPSDLVTALLARGRLQARPGGRVLYDLRSSWATPEAIEAAGGVAEMCRVGHSFVKARMRETGAIFAGELSGHFYFRFENGLVADDGTAAFVALLDALGREGAPLSRLMAPLRRYHPSGEISRRVKDPSRLLAEVEKEHADAVEISHLDGLLVRHEDWWFNLRPSNTEPVVRLNLEARSRERMVRERDRLLARMEAAA
jgi:phosphomannomutase